MCTSIQFRPSLQVKLSANCQTNEHQVELIPGSTGNSNFNPNNIKNFTTLRAYNATTKTITENTTTHTIYKYLKQQPGKKKSRLKLLLKSGKGKAPIFRKSSQVKRARIFKKENEHQVEDIPSNTGAFQIQNNNEEEKEKKTQTQTQTQTTTKTQTQKQTQKQTHKHTDKRKKSHV